MTSPIHTITLDSGKLLSEGKSSFDSEQSKSSTSVDWSIEGSGNDGSGNESNYSSSNESENEDSDASSFKDESDSSSSDGSSSGSESDDLSGTEDYTWPRLPNWSHIIWMWY